MSQKLEILKGKELRKVLIRAGDQVQDRPEFIVTYCKRHVQSEMIKIKN